MSQPPAPRGQRPSARTAARATAPSTTAPSTTPPTATADVRSADGVPLTGTAPTATPTPRAPSLAPSTTPPHLDPDDAAPLRNAAPVRGAASALPPLARARQGLVAVAVLACVPYLALKIAWICGSQLGIPDGSTLLDPDHRTTLRLVNGLSVVLDSAVIGIALLLTRPWGTRAPAWLLVVPMWCAVGLLTPIMIGFPAQLAGAALSGGHDSGPAGGGSDDSAFLADWVFGVVYGGFIVQGLTLGTLFVLYARDRWGHLWHGRLADLPPSPTRPALRIVTVAATVLALFPLCVHVLWATGSNAGLSPGRAYERDLDFTILETIYPLLLVSAVAGVLLIAFRPGSAVRLWVPLALSGVGSASVACWGGWLLLASLSEEGSDERMTALMSLTYAVQVITGTLIAMACAYFLAERGAGAAPSGPAARRALGMTGEPRPESREKSKLRAGRWPVPGARRGPC